MLVMYPCGQLLHLQYRDYDYLFLSDELWCPPLTAIDSTFMTTVHAPYHMTYM